MNCFQSVILSEKNLTSRHFMYIAPFYEQHKISAAVCFTANGCGT